MIDIALVWHSMSGHTDDTAGAIGRGVEAQAGCRCIPITIDQNGTVPDSAWASFNGAKAIVFGSATHFESVTWQFARFQAQSRLLWRDGAWHDKIAAGFAVAAWPGGGQEGAIAAMFRFAMHHGMIWVGTGMRHEQAPGPHDPVRNESTLGLAACGESACGEEGAGFLFGRRIARLTAQHFGEVVSKPAM